MLRCRPFGRWERHRESWQGRDAGDFNDVGEFAHQIIDSYRRGNEDELRASFALLERLIVEGSPHVRELAIVGVLEDVQNIASHYSFGFKVFEPWLGKESSQAWGSLLAAWKGKSHLVELVAEERGHKVRLRPWWAFWRREPPINLEEIENPELREIAEGLTRWQRSSGPK